MQLNQATDYAFRVVLHLSLLPAGRIVNGQTIAEQQNIPAQFLQKIMRALSRAGLVKSYRGIEGGFELARAPATITLFDVIVAMEGPIGIHRCLSDRASCTKNSAGRCAVHEALGQIQTELVQRLHTINFANLAEQQAACEKGG